MDFRNDVLTIRSRIGQRHDGGQGHRGRAADEDVDAKRFARLDSSRVMDADRAMDLIMQADLAVWLILTAGELDAVHAEV